MVGSLSALPPQSATLETHCFPFPSQLRFFPPAGGSVEPAWRPALFRLAEHVSPDLPQFFGLGQFNLTQTREGEEYQEILHTLKPHTSPSSALAPQSRKRRASYFQGCSREICEIKKPVKFITKSSTLVFIQRIKYLSHSFSLLCIYSDL